MAADTSAPAPKPAAEKKAKPARKTLAKKRPTKKAAPKPANKKPQEEITSKADLIRKVAGIIKAKGEKPRPTEIVKILEEEGITVAPAQVSMTLKAAGYRPLRKRRKGKKAAALPVAKKAAAAGRSSQVSMDDLLAAKSVAGAFGGADKAIAALRALERLQR